MRRRNAYTVGGLILLISAGDFPGLVQVVPAAARRLGRRPPASLQRFLNPEPRPSARMQSRRRRRAMVRLRMRILRDADLPAIPPTRRPSIWARWRRSSAARGADRKPPSPFSRRSRPGTGIFLSEALRRVCETSEITPAQIAGVASFYSQFRQNPVGEHIIRVCEGTACHVSGAVEVGNELRRCLGMTDDSDTDPAGRFTIERVACIGSCSLAPVITIDEKIYGKLSALSAGKVLRDFIDDGEKRPGTHWQRESVTAAGNGRRSARSPRRGSPDRDPDRARILRHRQRRSGSAAAP